MNGPIDWKPVSMAIVSTGTSYLFGVDQRRLGFPDPVMIEERIEIAVTEALIDELPQPVLRHTKLGG